MFGLVISIIYVLLLIRNEQEKKTNLKLEKEQNGLKNANQLRNKLNDRLRKKDLGAFYTPMIYAEKACELVKEAIDRVPEGNDYIILDTSPVLFASDSQIISNKADGTILVARSEKTKKNEIKETKMPLKPFLISSTP